jgi:glyoxylase-like metal-dependent hydrolase (beta-lactamase superfamily II)
MRVELWGVRGSIPVPGPATAQFGGNTSCVGVTALDGSEIVLDAGTGIRELGARITGHGRPLHVLLTHLHLDHILGLMFFAPFFDPHARVTVWGRRPLGEPFASDSPATSRTRFSDRDQGASGSRHIPATYPTTSQGWAKTSRAPSRAGSRGTHSPVRHRS